MLSYNHVQSIPSSAWVINHNLNTTTTVSDVSVMISGTLTKIIPQSVEHADNNTLIITFSSNKTGYARILGN